MIERSVAFGPGNGLIGTITLPLRDADPPATVAVITFNAGVVHRVGPHRINVRLARRLAARGIPSIRFDLSGQGDSARATGALGFEAQAIADLRAAMDRLCAECGIARFVLFGFCSGGCHSYAAAQQDDRVAGILLYDTYIYPTPWSLVNRYWLKIRYRGILNTVGRGLRRLVQRKPAANQPSRVAGQSAFRTPDPHAFADVVRRLYARGTRVGMIYSGSFEDYNYAEQFRDRFRSLGIDSIVTCDFLPSMGHTGSILATQEAFIERIAYRISEIDRPSDRSSVPNFP